MNPLFGSRRSSRCGFSLVELLVVIAIIGLLGVATSIMLPTIFGARSLSASTDAIANYLTFARSQAMGQNTYVIVGFNQQPITSSTPNDDLQVVGFRSLDGTYNGTNSTLLVATTTGNVTTGYYLPIGKVVHMPNVQLVQATALPAGLVTKLSNDGLVAGSGTNGTAIVDANASGSNSIPVGNLQLTTGSVTGNFTDAVIVFTPQGEALPIHGTPPTTLANIPFTKTIIIGINQSHGGVITANTTHLQGSAIVLDGGSGKVSEYRP